MGDTCLVVGTGSEGKFETIGVREVSEMVRRWGGENDENQLSAGGEGAVVEAEACGFDGKLK